MKKHTICGAAIVAINDNGKPMTAQAIYDYIIKNNLYDFKAKEPLSILKSELRKHTEGVNNSGRTSIKYKRIGWGAII